METLAYENFTCASLPLLDSEREHRRLVIKPKGYKLQGIRAKGIKLTRASSGMFCSKQSGKGGKQKDEFVSSVVW